MVANKIDFEGRVIANERYEILGLLGEGNMGLVYKARDRNLDAEVVMKVPTEESLRDEEFVERFKIEIRSMVRLSHPHVVSIIDTGNHVDDDGESVPYVVMQYLSGGSLKDRMVGSDGRRKPMPAESLGDWLVEVAKALDFMHGQQYIHRDVKPANILFDRHGNPFLSDFGLAKVLSAHEEDRASNSLTAAGFLVGTPNYVAPELVMGEPATAAVDQYSLAMTVYEVLTGTCPMEGPTASATMVNQTNRTPSPPHSVVESIPAGVSTTVLKGLSKSVEDRFPSCVAFAEAVLAAARGSSAATNGGPPRTGTGKARRSARKAPPSRSTRTTAPEPTEDEFDDFDDFDGSTNGAKMPPKVTRGGGGSSKKRSKGTYGKVKCPACGRVLPLKPEHAGQRGKCIHCKSRLEIGKDLKSLTLITASSPRLSVRSGDTSRGGSSATSRHPVGEDILIGEKMFGLDLSKKAAISIFFALITVVVGASIFIGVYSSRDKEKEKQDAIDDIRRPENSSPSRPAASTPRPS